MVGQLKVDIADKSVALQPSPPTTSSLMLVSVWFPSVFRSFPAELRALTFYEQLWSGRQAVSCGQYPPVFLQSQN